jgi:hypothetical protein
MRQRKFSFFAIAVLLALGASGAFATATLQFILDGTLVDTCVDNAGCDTVATTGVVNTTYSNALVAITVGTGTTKPAITTPTMDLDDVTVTLAAGHQLTLVFSDIGFAAKSGFTMIDGGSLSGCTGCSSQSWSFFDTTNTLFGITAGTPASAIDPNTGTLIGTIGPQGPGAVGGTVIGAGPSTTPYSLTTMITLNNTRGTGAAFLSSDLSLTQTPEPTSILLLGTLASLVAYGFRRKFSGNNVA